MVVLEVVVELILITQEEQELQTKGSLGGQPTALMVVVEELLRQEQKETEIAHLQVELVVTVETD
jgi:hypothetical protein